MKDRTDSRRARHAAMASQHRSRSSRGGSDYPTRVVAAVHVCVVAVRCAASPGIGTSSSRSHAYRCSGIRSGSAGPGPSSRARCCAVDRRGRGNGRGIQLRTGRGVGVSPRTGSFYLFGSSSYLTGTPHAGEVIERIADCVYPERLFGDRGRCVMS